MARTRSKNDQTTTHIERVSAEQALEFIDAFQKMMADRDEPTKLISLRVPENILRAMKTKAKFEQKKYQTLMIQAFRDFLRKD